MNESNLKELLIFLIGFFIYLVSGWILYMSTFKFNIQSIRKLIPLIVIFSYLVMIYSQIWFFRIQPIIKSSRNNKYKELEKELKRFLIPITLVLILAVSILYYSNMMSVLYLPSILISASYILFLLFLYKKK